ncbi:MAG: hypothetical protein HYY24_15430 [Verrucomicrobia bacterium]|nr:hypothetical protein [Verrucomicrobiota bacterium]
MNAQPPKDPMERRPLLPLLLLHFAAAGVCFAFFTVVPMAGCVILMAIDNDPGGPMFFPIFVMGIVLFAAVITAFLAGAALTSDLLRRHYRVSVWLPPLVVFVLATVSCWLLFSSVHPAVPPIAGGVVALAFIIHWTAISTVWFLPRLLFRLFRVQHAPPKG